MRIPFVCLLVGSVLGVACDENLDPKTPQGAMHQLRDAVTTNNTDLLLSLSSASTHTLLVQLHTLLKEQAVAVAERYPEVHRRTAKLAYPAGALEATDSKALFAALVKPGLEGLETLEMSDGLRFGMSVMGAPTIEGERASVATQSGESVEFVLEDGIWKATIFERAIEANLNRARLNQQTLEENLKVFRELDQRAKRKKKKKKKKEAAAPPPPP